MADKKQFSNTKSIVKVATGIVTLISYHNYLKIVGNNKLWPHMQKRRKLKYSRNENFSMLHYVEWDRIVTLAGANADWGLRYRIYETGCTVLQTFSISSHNFDPNTRNMDKLSRLHTRTWSLATTRPISFLRLIEGEQQIHAKFADCIHCPNLLYTMSVTIDGSYLFNPHLCN
jgi:hypothetical protein